MEPAAIRGVFWNVGNRDRRQLIRDLVGERELNLVVLAESPHSDSELLSLLAGVESTRFICPLSATPRVQLAGASEWELEELYSDVSRRLTIRRALWFGEEYLMAAVHAVSKRWWKETEQQAEAQRLAAQIRDRESERGHRRTIVVGDFNMNPFEPGVVQAAGFHALMCKDDVAEGSRAIQGESYPYFYNPMWGFFGDRTPGPAGTYFYRGTAQLAYNWNMFDQILVRPDVLGKFQEEVEIVEHIGDVSLVDSRGRPDPTVGSDHLPLYFRFSQRREAL
jgi:hypothetical protein